MSRPRRNLAGTLFLATALAIVAASAALADLDGARAAYDEGDYVAARAQLEPLAQGGDAEALELYEAAAWFRKAAARDHGYAMYALGLMHDLGRGVTRSHGEAMLWYRRAAHKGV